MKDIREMYSGIQKMYTVNGYTAHRDILEKQEDEHRMFVLKMINDHYDHDHWEEERLMSSFKTYYNDFDGRVKEVESPPPAPSIQFLPKNWQDDEKLYSAETKYIKWTHMLSNYAVNESFLEKMIKTEKKPNFFLIAKYQILKEDFIEKYKNEFDWGNLVNFQKHISYEFFVKMEEYTDWRNMPKRFPKIQHKYCNKYQYQKRYCDFRYGNARGYY